MAKAKVLRLRQIFQEDEAGWVEYPSLLPDGYGVLFNWPNWPDLLFPKRRGGFMYVQGEDAHTIIEMYMEKRGFTPRYTQWEVADFKAWLKSDRWPKLRKWKGDKR